MCARLDLAFIFLNAREMTGSRGLYITLLVLFIAHTCVDFPFPPSRIKIRVRESACGEKISIDEGWEFTKLRFRVLTWRESQLLVNLPECLPIFFGGEQKRRKRIHFPIFLLCPFFHYYFYRSPAFAFCYRRFTSHWLRFPACKKILLCCTYIFLQWEIREKANISLPLLFREKKKKSKFYWFPGWKKTFAFEALFPASHFPTMVLSHWCKKVIFSWFSTKKVFFRLMRGRQLEFQWRKKYSQMNFLF